MPLTPPQFWNHPHSWQGYLLEPLSWLYQGGAALHQLFSKPWRASVPVISIGNFVLGGAGKTPVTRAIAQYLQTLGYTPHIISRGYGGGCKGPLLVDPSCHPFHHVGDEPLLLAKTAPTWVSRNRKDAAPLAIKAGTDVLLLDDGHQNHSLYKDICLMVVNASQGFGNGRVFPAGPLRQSIRAGLKTTTAIIFIGQEQDPLPDQLSELRCPLMRARIEPIAPKPCPVVAFAGLGYPEKFRQTLVDAGYDVKAFYAFPDHYPYKDTDLAILQEKARAERACLVTTEKDALRLPPLHQRDVLTLPITLTFEPETALRDLLHPLLTSLRV